MALARQILYNYRMNRIDMFLLSQLDMYQKFFKTTLSIINKLPTLNKNNLTIIFTELDQQHKKHIPKLSALAKTIGIKPQFIHFKPIEVRELYDSNRRKTGEIIRKGEKIPTGRYYITVVIWIEDQFGNFLIQKNKKYNLWSTAGGHPKYRETSLEGIQTEVEEELGLKIKKKHLTLFKTLKTEDDFIDLYYIKIPHTQKFYLQKDEVDAIKWANISEIKDLIKQKLFLPPHIDFLKELIEWKKNGR